jgi:ribonuclease-3
MAEFSHLFTRQQRALDGLHTFKDADILKVALTHSSVLKLHHVQSYERLEFLGNGVVNLVLADLLYRMHPEASEGELSIMHAKLVGTGVISGIAQGIGLGDLLWMDKGEEKIGGRQNPRNLEDSLEAVIGAIYVDGGYNAAKVTITKLWQAHISMSQSLLSQDSKSRLQEWSQRNGFGLPTYTLESQSGPDHQPEFTACVFITNSGKEYGSGKSKKLAAHAAALNMLRKLGESA